MVLLSSVMSSCFRLCFFPANPFTIPSIHSLRMHKKKKSKASLVPCYRNGSKVARYSRHVGIVYSSSIVSTFLGVECIKISLEASPSRVFPVASHSWTRLPSPRYTYWGHGKLSDQIRWQIYMYRLVPWRGW